MPLDLSIGELKLYKPNLKSQRLISGATLVAMSSVTLAATPTQVDVQKLLASDGGGSGQFGSSVAVSGDTAVIGAPLRDDAAYVYTRDASGDWSEQAKLVASDTIRFGASVAVSSDTIVVGASYTSQWSGSAYVLTRGASGVWSEQAELLASDGADFEFFGASVAVSGDTALIGSPEDDDNGDHSGSAYVYTRDTGGVWTEQAKILASDGAAFDQFGVSVALGDDTAVIGAPGDDDNGDQSGSVYVYTRDTSGVWTEQAKLVSSDGEAQDRFGRSVAISGDTTVISAPIHDDERGAAYVYTRDTGGVWTEQAKLLASDGAAGDGFGALPFSGSNYGGPSVTLSGDTAVIGAWGDDDHEGSAYVFTRDASGAWSEQAKLLPSDSAAYPYYFGSAVSVSGNNVVVGAPNNQEQGPLSGAAYVYRLDQAHVSPTLHCSGDITGDGVAELVLVSGADVQVKDLNGTGINRFELAAITGAEDTELMPDTNSNGAPELVAFGGSPATAEVRDPLTGGNLGTVTFNADLVPVDLELVTDRTGNGIPELAALGEYPMKTEVRDALSATLVNDVLFTRYSLGKDLLIYPDQDGNGAPELAVLADKRKPEWADKIEIRDSDTGAIVRQIWLGRDWRVLEQELIADLNGNGTAEVAVLRVHPEGNVNVQIRDTVTREWVNFVGFPVKYPPQELVAIPDIDGNGADELVVFGRRFDGRDQKAVIKDSKTGQVLGELWFDPNFPGRDFVDCGDLNGNGAQDLALFGQRPSDGRLKVIVKDSRTGERLALVWFD